MRTHSSALQGGFGPQTSTTWVAWQDGTGPWQVLAPRGTGAYAFSVTGTRYGVALVCATPGAGLTIGTLYYRTTATRELLLPVGEFCDESNKPEPAVVRGRVENHGMSRWVSMGWAGGSEGMLINPAAAAPLANYDFSITTFGLRANVKDFTFALREFTGRSPLTRMAFRRRVGNVPPSDLDFTTPAIETAQTASFAVGRRLLRITGSAAGEVWTFFQAAGARPRSGRLPADAHLQRKLGRVDLLRRPAPPAAAADCRGSNSRRHRQPSSGITFCVVRNSAYRRVEDVRMNIKPTWP